MLRRILPTFAFCLCVVAMSAIESHAQTTTLDRYYAYVAGESITAEGKISYLVMDSALTASTGPERDIYISYFNDATGDYGQTSEDKLTEVNVLSDRASYAGTMYYNRHWCPFRLEVFPSAEAPSGYAIKFTVWNRKSTAVIVDRTDLLNSYSRVIFNPPTS